MKTQGVLKYILIRSKQKQYLTKDKGWILRNPVLR